MFTGVTPQMTIARDEIFGPVLSTLTFKTADEAIAFANDSEYGLLGQRVVHQSRKRAAGHPSSQRGAALVNSVIDGAPEIPYRRLQEERYRP